uniref:Uncharacterized protein n=1 Tax=Cacopsylla melanoneura TaxID=428564 RepID=A0A8D8XF05_9HEMI
MHLLFIYLCNYPLPTEHEIHVYLQNKVCKNRAYQYSCCKHFSHLTQIFFCHLRTFPFSHIYRSMMCIAHVFVLDVRSVCGALLQVTISFLKVEGLAQTQAQVMSDQSIP